MNEHEAFWAGDFGNSYTARNKVKWPTRTAFWGKILAKTGAKSVLEVGCNEGANLLAIQRVSPSVNVIGADVNVTAIEEARRRGLDVSEVPAREVGGIWRAAFDLTATVGVLIHIPPADLDEVMRSIIEASNRFVLAVEYEATQELEIKYRGHANRLWSRPYGALYQKHGLDLVASGDAGPGFDQCTYWLMRKP